MSIDRDIKEYFSVVVERLKELPPKEALSYAIFNEEEEAEYYNKLAGLAKKTSIKVLFIQMAEESLDHKQRLLKLFQKLYPGEEPVKVDAPPVEVVPFFPAFESVDDYIEALEYCMESEKFARSVYEFLASNAQDEDSKGIYSQLAIIESGHYERLKKAYELMLGMKARNLEIASLKPGAYLFQDKLKARYTFLDLLGKGRAIVISRDHPEDVKAWMRHDVEVIWLTRGTLKKGLKGINPKVIAESPEDFWELVREGSFRVVLLEGVESLLVDVEEKQLLKILLTLKDMAAVDSIYLVVQGALEAFSERGRAILTSEFKPLN